MLLMGKDDVLDGRQPVPRTMAWAKRPPGYLHRSAGPDSDAWWTSTWLLAVYALRQASLLLFGTGDVHVGLECIFFFARG